jgi:hypothetical protein
VEPPRESAAKPIRVTRDDDIRVVRENDALKSERRAADVVWMGRGVLIVSACALLTCVSATAAGSATTPATYRAQVNGICRTYTPFIKREEAAATAAQAAKNMPALGVALGHIQRLALAQDQHIEAVAVPAALHRQLAPILSLLQQIDLHLRSGISKLLAGDGKGWAAELDAAGSLSRPLDAKFDAAGLRDCGSNQP